MFQKVRGTNIKDMDTSADQGEGLFVTCDIKQGELISFYSGHMVHHSGPHSLHRRKISDSSKIYQQKYDVTYRLILSSDWERELEYPRRWQLVELEIEMVLEMRIDIEIKMRFCLKWKWKKKSSNKRLRVCVCLCVCLHVSHKC